jgi:hypothetical protein
MPLQDPFMDFGNSLWAMPLIASPSKRNKRRIR